MNTLIRPNNTLDAQEIRQAFWLATKATLDIEQAIMDLDEARIQDCLNRGAIIDRIPTRKRDSDADEDGGGYYWRHLIENEKNDLLWQIMETAQNIGRDLQENLLKMFAKQNFVEDAKRLAALCNERMTIGDTCWIALEALKYNSLEFLEWLIDANEDRKTDLLAQIKKVGCWDVKINDVRTFDLLDRNGFVFGPKELIYNCLDPDRANAPNLTLLKHMLEYGIRLTQPEESGLAWLRLLQPSSLLASANTEIIQCARLLLDSGAPSPTENSAPSTQLMLLSIELGQDPNEALSRFNPGSDEIWGHLNSEWQEPENRIYALRHIFDRLEYFGIERETILERIPEINSTKPGWRADKARRGLLLSFWQLGFQNMDEVPDGGEHPEIMAMREEVILTRNTKKAISNRKPERL